ncbi:LIC_13355 family lipoprotein [Leptospira sp. 2 VSF19]|uniref:LIC_13355 family lipoprotein n=1 Tax=Leptospira soteropolitanensis TaxID=2950025 RepID=A0AAW5VHL6_9LEPT|nr:LIC_13355 family lipoprotein [Leptospira soteropolitanensis]MCW7491145.1 LIC_13355 family lipoprotein [Leptospira soteropolitanensis]MCW7498729.1 LIC_13355 family lipoprotein [Leptospira soteropolitanensis]MCW7521678.1 LIC_13355 family lipoprotein [Leptospira soteropolitanensis]MCW7524833.1 LIC_13355 family lipoprotein [Leptospira soteropolitanensis]MCW7528700.1 LIC_13355 family lipoprotein [Leptospira soteropolitanensis]
MQLLTRFKISGYLFLWVLAYFSHCKNSSSSGENLAALLPLLNLTSDLNFCPKSPLPSEIQIATTVVSASANVSGFSDKNKAINGICGSGDLVGSLDVYALDITGPGASIVLSWGGKTVKNVTGDDFIVYDNSFRISDESNTYAMDPSVIQVSIDNTNFCGFNPSYTGGGVNIMNSWNRFGGLRPVYYNMSTKPFTNLELFTKTNGSFLLGGGDGFDLEDLDPNDPNDTGCDSNLVDTIRASGFKFLKITSAAEVNNPNTGSKFPWPPGSYNGSDIDGVVARELQ